MNAGAQIIPARRADRRADAADGVANREIIDVLHREGVAHPAGRRTCR